MLLDSVESLADLSRQQVQDRVTMTGRCRTWPGVRRGLVATQDCPAITRTANGLISAGLILADLMSWQAAGVHAAICEGGVVKQFAVFRPPVVPEIGRFPGRHQKSGHHQDDGIAPAA
jgi:hypothetical protein